MHLLNHPQNIGAPAICSNVFVFFIAYFKNMEAMPVTAAPIIPLAAVFIIFDPPFPYIRMATIFFTLQRSVGLV